MRLHRHTAIILALTGLLASAPTQAAGLLTPVGTSTPLEIREHRVSVTVEDSYVVTEVDQVFANGGHHDLEAHYTFPVPAHAAVAEFTYWIDGQPVHGEVLKKAAASELYAAEKAAGRETALATKDAYRTFDMRVSPVRAGQDVRLRLVYLQSAAVDSGIGRYVYPLEDGGVDEERNAFWTTESEVRQRFDFNFELKSSYPVDAVRVPAQPGAAVRQMAGRHWRVTLAGGGVSSGDVGDRIAQIEEGHNAIAPAAPAAVAKLDEDIVVYWRHAAGQPGAVDLVAHRDGGGGRGTFMLTFTPGDDLPVIESGRDFVFVLDVSGSMAGKFATLADGVAQALGKLEPRDRFRIYTFSNTTTEITSGFVPATLDQVQHYVASIGTLRSGGGTNLYAGLSAGLDGLHSDRTSAVALITDGVANVGVTQKKSFLDLLARRDVRLFTFILGNSANRPLLEAMTDVSNGFALHTSNSDDIGGQLLQAVGKIRHAAMHDVALNIDGVKVADLTPARIGSLYRGEQLNVLGHYFKAGTAQVELTGKVQGRSVRYATTLDFPISATSNPELERLWAYATIENLQAQMDYVGEDNDTAEAIVDLAVEYGLVTDHTSMIVVRDEVFEARGIERRNRQRVTAERSARAQRQNTAPVDRRADRTQPMFKHPRPSTGGGGGAFGLPLLLVLALVALRRLRATTH